MADQPTLLTQPFAENGDKNVIPNTTAQSGAFSQDKGFPAETSLPLGAGGVAPSRQDFNGAFNMLSRLAFYQQKGWTWHFDETQDYYAGCIVIDDTDDNKYICIDDVAAGGSVPSADTTHWEIYSMGGGVPAGTILAYGGSVAPDGYLFADGSAVSRTDYADLFAVYGTTFGAGDGTTTFNLPDLTGGRFLEGDTTVGTYKDAGLPNIEGSFAPWSIYSYTSSSGAFTRANYGTHPDAPAGGDGTLFSFDASLSSAVYGKSTTVQPKSLTCRIIIKY